MAGQGDERADTVLGKQHWRPFRDRSLVPSWEASIGGCCLHIALHFEQILPGARHEPLVGGQLDLPDLHRGLS